MENTAEDKPTKQETTRYFAKRASGSLSAMRANKGTGLFPKSEGWRNVVEHELVEAEASDVLAESLGLSQSDRDTLRVATLLHDSFKRREIEALKELSIKEYDESAKDQSEYIASLGYSSQVVELTKAVGHTSLPDFLANYDSIPLIKKIMHYVDDITKNNDIVLLDQRMDALEQDPKV